MRCHICDKELSDKEVIYNDDLKGLEPCTTCLDIAMDAAYSDGFQHEDDETIIIGDFDILYDGDSSDIVPRYMENEHN